MLTGSESFIFRGHNSESLLGVVIARAAKMLGHFLPCLYGYEKTPRTPPPPPSTTLLPSTRKEEERDTVDSAHPAKYSRIEEERDTVDSVHPARYSRIRRYLILLTVRTQLDIQG